jgi:hypothetical protein
LIFLVTTSLCQDWVICAPAAFLGCGSRLSGSLSGIPHPRSVTRHNHGKTIPYHRKLIGQKFERCVALACDQKKNHESPHIGLISDWYHGLPRVVARISSRITTVIRVVGTIEETIAVLPSHSQFRRKNYLYLHLHGLVLETSIYHWQDQPGSRMESPRPRIAAPPSPKKRKCGSRAGQRKTTAAVSFFTEPRQAPAFFQRSRDLRIFLLRTFFSLKKVASAHSFSNKKEL